MRGHRRSEWSRVAAVGASMAATAIGGLALLGWTFGIGVLVRLDPTASAMAPLTAVLAAIAGLTICFGFPLAAPGAGGPPRGRYGTVRTGGAALILLLLGGRAIAWWLAPEWRPDSLGFTVADFGRASLAPTTGVAFALLATALLVHGRLRWPGVYDTLVLISGFIGWLGLSAQIFGGAALVPFRLLSLHSALAVLLLNGAAMAARRDAGVTALLVADSAGGYAARRLVPAALALPIAMGWLRLQAQRAGWFGTEAGLSIFALANVLVFGGLIWSVARQLHESDLERRQAEDRTRAELHHLQLLEQITRSIAQRLDLRSIHGIVADTLRDHLAMDFAAFCDYEPASQRFRARCVMTRGGGPLLAEGDTFPVDANGLRRAVGGELVCERDVTTGTRPLAVLLGNAGLHSLAVVPLAVEGRVTGVLLAARRAVDAFSSRECEFLRQLGDHVALAAHQQHLHQSLQLAYDELRETQRAAMQQERLRVLGQMASGIAHDINNALTPALLLMETLLETEAGLSTEAREAIAVVQQSIQDASKTVERLREFYRPRDPSRAPAPVDLNAVSTQVLAMASAHWKDISQRRGVAIEARTDLAPALPPVPGMESEIREALTNLLINAVDAMPEGGTLTVRTRAIEPERGGSAAAIERAAVALEVQDTGTGMDEKTRQRCLEPFFTTKGERGTGLGLAMVYGIAQRHGAELEIDSAPGRGTTVRLVLPTQSPQAVAVDPVPAAPPAAARPAPARILAIDDDPVLLATLRAVLERDGHQVTTAAGGAEGLDLFRAALAGAEPFAVVITDLGMPYVDGRQVADTVKALSPAMPVILLTGWGHQLADEGELPPHIDLMLSKPPKLHDLRDALARVLPASPA